MHEVRVTRLFIDKYKPPAIYFIAEALVLGVMTWRNESMQDRHNAALYIYWIIAAITFVLYSLAACVSPGYVTGQVFRESHVNRLNKMNRTISR